jgi:integrase
MSRTNEKTAKVRDQKFDTPTARLKFVARREPYWRAIEPGFSLGYRRIAGKGGTWIARHYDQQNQKIRYSALGAADDFAAADGREFRTFGQAQAAARIWLDSLARAAAGGVDPTKPYTVGDALDDYLADYVTEGKRAEYETRQTIEVLIRPTLGTIHMSKLTQGQLRGFRDGIARTGRRLRTKKGEAPRYAALDAGDADALRKRRATANRVFAFLRAALNLALRNAKVASDAAWRSIKPFKSVDLPKIRYLNDAEALRVANASAPDLRAIVTAALLTGCRYGELTRIRTGDFDRETGMLHIPITKAGSSRFVALSEEGRRFFEQVAKGASGSEIVFKRANGKAWKANEQTRPLSAACRAAKILPEVSFHILRHTYASRLARAGVPMSVIAAQLGHADLRITTRHYAHLSPGYVAETVRAAFGSMGLLLEQNPTNPI